MALPIKTSVEDCEKVVAYLKGKPAGATVAQAKSVLDPKHLDGRKLKAYEAWGLVTNDGGRLNLTPEGREVGRMPEAAAAHYRSVIARQAPYRSALERAFHAGHRTL